MSFTAKLGEENQPKEDNGDSNNNNEIDKNLEKGSDHLIVRNEYRAFGLIFPDMFALWCMYLTFVFSLIYMFFPFYIPGEEYMKIYFELAVLCLLLIPSVFCWSSLKNGNSLFAIVFTVCGAIAAVAFLAHSIYLLRQTSLWQRESVKVEESFGPYIIKLPTTPKIAVGEDARPIFNATLVTNLRTCTNRLATPAKDDEFKISMKDAPSSTLKMPVGVSEEDFYLPTLENGTLWLPVRRSVVWACTYGQECTTWEAAQANDKSLDGSSWSIMVSYCLETIKMTQEHLSYLYTVSLLVHLAMFLLCAVSVYSTFMAWRFLREFHELNPNADISLDKFGSRHKN